MVNVALISGSSAFIGQGINYTSTVLLPPRPAQLSMLNGITMKNFIRGLMKDLKLTWASQKPEWWPTEIPYQNINSGPSGLEGKYTLTCIVLL